MSDGDKTDAGTKRALAVPTRAMPGVANFARISSVLYRGAQPTRAGFLALREMGIKTIVNLRAYRRDNGRIKGLGLQFVHLRCRAWLPSNIKLAAFLKLVRDPANQPVFVHCLHGSDRTGLAVACYRIMEEGWTLDEAVAELHAFGFHRRIFPQILRYLKRFDSGKMRALIEGSNAPRIGVAQTPAKRTGTWLARLKALSRVTRSAPKPPADRDES